MTEQAISPLRRRMIEDMTIRKFAPKTQASYIRAVRNFTIFLGRAPDQASAEDLRRYQLHLAASGVAVPSQNATVTALRFFVRARCYSLAFRRASFICAVQFGFLALRTAKTSPGCSSTLPISRAQLRASSHLSSVA